MVKRPRWSTPPKLSTVHLFISCPDPAIDGLLTRVACIARHEKALGEPDASLDFCAACDAGKRRLRDLESRRHPPSGSTLRQSPPTPEVEARPTIPVAPYDSAVHDRPTPAFGVKVPIVDESGTTTRPGVASKEGAQETARENGKRR